MIVTDLTELADDSAGKEAAAAEQASDSIDSVLTLCQATMGHMVKASEMLEVGAISGGDFDAVMGEFLEAQRQMCMAQATIGKTVRALHQANRALTATNTLEFLQTAETTCDTT